MGLLANHLRETRLTAGEYRHNLEIFRGVLRRGNGGTSLPVEDGMA
jgi:hypothetical protein